MTIDNPPQGWGFPLNSRKAHYFKAGSATSICRKWLYFGDRQDDKHASPDNCVECKRRREREAINQ